MVREPSIVVPLGSTEGVEIFAEIREAALFRECFLQEGDELSVVHGHEVHSLNNFSRLAA
jgi:hypothetical protein